MQNMRIGMAVSSWPVTVKSPSRPERWPSWKIHTIAPNVAERLSVLSSSALIGMTTEPVNRNSSRNVEIAMMPIAHGRRSPMASCESANTAADRRRRSFRAASRPRGCR